MQHSIDRLRVALVDLDGKPLPAMGHAACLTPDASSALGLSPPINPRVICAPLRKERLPVNSRESAGY